MVQTSFIKKDKATENKKMTHSRSFWVVFILCFGGILTILSVDLLFLIGVFGFIFFAILNEIIGNTEKKWIITPVLFFMRLWMVFMYVGTFLYMGLFLGKSINLLTNFSTAPYVGAATGFIAGIVTIFMLIKKTLK